MEGSRLNSEKITYTVDPFLEPFWGQFETHFMHRGTICILLRRHGIYTNLRNHRNQFGLFKFFTKSTSTSILVIRNRVCRNIVCVRRKGSNKPIIITKRVRDGQSIIFSHLSSTDFCVFNSEGKAGEKNFPTGKHVSGKEEKRMSTVAKMKITLMTTHSTDRKFGYRGQKTKTWQATGKKRL